MLGTALRQLVWRRGRSGALAVGIGVATVSFSLLTATVSTSGTRITGIIRSSLRPAYDILVLPPGAAESPLARSAGLVRDNYLSGIFGGISLEQYRQVKKVPGVQVAAPIAMIGYVMWSGEISVPVRALPTSGEQVYLVSSHVTADRGLSTLPVQGQGYLYVTDHPLKPPPSSFEVSPGRLLGPTERLADGRTVTVCPAYTSQSVLNSPFSSDLTVGRCVSRAHGRPVRVRVDVPFSFPVLLAAVDPAEENRLVGLRRTVVAGRYLRPHDAPAPATGRAGPAVPVLVSSVPFTDDKVTVTISSLPASAASDMTADLTPTEIARRLAALPAVPVQHTTVAASQTFMAGISSQGSSRPGSAAGAPSFERLVDAYWTVGPVRYSRLGRQLAPMPQVNPQSVWQSVVMANGYVMAPEESMDVGFRHLTEHVANNRAVGAVSQIPSLRWVGSFNPRQLPGFSGLSAVPLETYYPPVALGADPATRRALGGQPLLPDGNVAGYLQAPPLMLTTLNSLPTFTNPSEFSGTRPDAPISVIRVRVSGLTGSVAHQLSQVAQVAFQIKKVTGLRVEVTAGSSPTTVTVTLPAGRYGRPELRLDEGWVRKGVALVVVRALDRKSVTLFMLILVVTGLFLANGVLAEVRSRRTEIGVLRAVGWPRVAVFRLVLEEVALLGLAAGLAGSALSAVLIYGLGLQVPLDRVTLVTPVSVMLAALAALGPAWLASRGAPLDVIRPALPAARRARRVRTLAGLALSNLRMLRWRAALAAAALAAGVASLTVLLSITLTFRGGVAGSVMGQFVTVQARGADYVSAGLIVALGALSVADVMYLNMRERAGELAALTASGWRRADLVRVGLGEALGVGLAGTAVGAGAGLALAAVAFDDLPAVAAAAAAAATGAVLVVLAASRVSLEMVTRGQLAAVLAQED